MDGGLNNLLKWSIENTEAAKAGSQNGSDARMENSTAPRTQLTPEMMQALMGGPSDADLMRESMAAIQNPQVSLEDKLIAFDNFEQLIESLDNANNMHPLGLWPPLVEFLEHEEPEMRRYAAWCAGTAVQNNISSQEKLVAARAIPKLVALAAADPQEPVRRKAIYALSSAVRNYQPAMDEAVKVLPKTVVPEGAIDAGNMDSLDHIMQKLRDDSAVLAIPTPEA